MRRCWLFLAVLAVMLMVTPLFAQQDPNDPNEADTVICRGFAVVIPDQPWPDSIGVPIYYWGDQELGGFSLGFDIFGTVAGGGNIDDFITVSSFSNAGAETPATGWIATPTLKDEAGNRLLFGALDFAGVAPWDPPVGLLGTIYYHIDPSTPSGTVASLDSSYVPPGGTFTATIIPESGAATSITPLFDNRISKGYPNIVLGDAPPVVSPVDSVWINDVVMYLDSAYIFMNEGDTLMFEVEVFDYENQLQGLNVEGDLPDNATFELDGEIGTFTFMPSASQGSLDGDPPYEITFSALDGASNTGMLTIMIGVDDVLAVKDLESPTLPERFSLQQNYPNPFNPTTTIDFSVPRPGDVRLEIYNVLGQSIRVLVDEYLSAGEKRVEWDGLDQSGRPASSGIYLYRLSADDFGQTKKMLLLK